MLLTSNSDMPVHVQPPTLSTMINPHPIYVAYMQYGAGHYDAVIPVKDSGVNTVETLPSTSTDIVKSSVEQTCNCGRKSGNGQSCVFPCFSIHADVLVTIVSNHAKQSAGAKTAQIHSVLERNKHLMLVQNVNVLHTKIRSFHCKGRGQKHLWKPLVNQYLLVALVILNF